MKDELIYLKYYSCWIGSERITGGKSERVFSDKKELEKYRIELRQQTGCETVIFSYESK